MIKVLIQKHLIQKNLINWIHVCFHVHIFNFSKNKRKVFNE